MRRRQSIEDQYNDLLERLNAVEFEVPGHTDKFRNKAPMPIWSGENGEFDDASLVTPAMTRTVQPPPGFGNFGPRTIDAVTRSPWENNYAAAYPSPESDTDQDFVPTPQTPWSQPVYAAAPFNFAQQHFRNRSSMGSSGTLPPSCATAATFSPASAFSNTLDGPGCSMVPPLDFNPLPRNAPFTPSLMVQELNGQYHPDDVTLAPHLNPYADSNGYGHPGVNAASGCSRNYKGNHFLQSNRSADIPDKDNCSFFITGLPPAINTHTLLAHIRDAGRIYASYINDANPSAGHLTAAAKLVFFDLSSAREFWARYTKDQLPLMVSGYAAKVVRNRIKVADPSWSKEFTRVVVISGPSAMVTIERLMKIFEENFVFHIDEIIEDPPELPELDRVVGWIMPRGWRTIEVRFGSWRSQAQTCCQLLEKHPELRGLHFRYGRDPCDRIDSRDRHLYRISDAAAGYGYGDGIGMGGYVGDAEQNMYLISPQTSNSSPGGGAPLGLDFASGGSLGASFPVNLQRPVSKLSPLAESFGDVFNRSCGRQGFATAPSDRFEEEEDSGAED